MLAHEGKNTAVYAAGASTHWSQASTYFCKQTETANCFESKLRLTRELGDTIAHVTDVSIQNKSTLVVGSLRGLPETPHHFSKKKNIGGVFAKPQEMLSWFNIMNTLKIRGVTIKIHYCELIN